MTLVWLKRFHDDHTALLAILPKLEGNLKEIEHGEAGENVIWELIEFEELIKNVIIPHFREEEKSVYPRASGAGGEEYGSFFEGLYKEHDILYEAFDGFFKVLDESRPPAKSGGRGKLVRPPVSVAKTPKNFDRVRPVQVLHINREEILKHGNSIIKYLKIHINKEETVVAELAGRVRKEGG
ncbi:MAG TPA: hemerythrin domain-containing protein [Bacillota bacterium]|nr:hemerythrin domain-containing protein [Bacillota bacterium]